ncbi:MAG: helix-turn-helix domain-containing protein [Firmicutes bacterium]|nr:helix-turn-helix domain-containing protein [Bacillota bacterium]
MTQEVGIDFDQFIECLRLNRTDAEMAVEFDVSEKTITCLRNHFERYGLDSVMGGD